jgi:hypothetical protein
MSNRTDVSSTDRVSSSDCDSSSETDHVTREVIDLKNTRDLRTLLLQAAYDLQSHPAHVDITIVLRHCQLLRKRVQSEVDLFKSICQPELAERIKVVDQRTGSMELARVGSGQGSSSQTLPDSEPLLRPPARASQEAVMAYLLWRYIQGLDGVTIAQMVQDTGASVPTVYQVIHTLRQSLQRDPENKTWRLVRVSDADWQRWFTRTNQLASVQFVDRSGSPRSARRLADALRRLNRPDVAIGGLMGALHHLPALDATAAPCLDLLVHGTSRSDLSFIRQMDPGLERSKDRSESPHVVVHFVDRPNALFTSSDGRVWGALPDCIANMHKAGLTHQVEDAVRLIRVGVG